MEVQTETTTQIHSHFMHLLTHLLTYLLTQWSRALLEKLTGSQLVKKFPAFYGTQRYELPHSQVPATCPWPEPAQSSPYPHSDPSYYFPPIYAWVSQVVSFLQVSPPKWCFFFAHHFMRFTQNYALKLGHNGAWDGWSLPLYWPSWSCFMKFVLSASRFRCIWRTSVSSLVCCSIRSSRS